MMNTLKKSKFVSTKNSQFHVNLPHQEYEEVRQTDVLPVCQELGTCSKLFSIVDVLGANITCLIWVNKRYFCILIFWG